MSAAERARAVADFDPVGLERLASRATSSTAGEDLPVLASGMAASPGRGLGAAYFSVESTLAALDRGEAVVLVTTVTSPAEEPAMRHVAGVVTARGGTTSHAAIVARCWGVPAVCGVDTLRFEGAVARFGDVAVARRFGAGGVGLSRSEHWFLGEDSALITGLLSGGSPAERAPLLVQFFDLMRATAERLLDELDGAPLTVRLLDAPPEEFGVARQGHGGRGVQVVRASDDLYRTQLRALAEVVAGRAAVGEAPCLRVLVPMVAAADDVDLVRTMADEAVDRVWCHTGTTVALEVGAMIETPRAALTAAAIAQRSAFVSIGTNDLAAFVWGLDRNSVPSTGGVDPFGSLDVDGVGRLVELAVAEARSAKTRIEVGVCGEVAGDPASIGWLLDAGVNSLSVSPYRVPAARLAVAQALLRLDADGAASSRGAG